MTTRQEPEIYRDDYDLPVRRYKAWGICTSQGVMAEVTLDPDKASVWRQGGHKVLELVNDEPIEAGAEIEETKQSKLL